MAKQTYQFNSAFFAGLVSDWCGKKQLKQKDLAEVLGIAPPTLTQYISGLQTPSENTTLPKICELFGVKPEHLKIDKEVIETGYELSSIIKSTIYIYYNAVGVKRIDVDDTMKYSAPDCPPIENLNRVAITDIMHALAETITTLIVEALEYRQRMAIHKAR